MNFCCKVSLCLSEIQNVVGLKSFRLKARLEKQVAFILRDSNVAVKWDKTFCLDKELHIRFPYSISSRFWVKMYNCRLLRGRLRHWLSNFDRNFFWCDQFSFIHCFHFVEFPSCTAEKFTIKSVLQSITNETVYRVFKLAVGDVWSI